MQNHKYIIEDEENIYSGYSKVGKEMASPDIKEIALQESGI